LAANQGLYNGFLATGLVLALIEGATGEGGSLAHFVLTCVIVAGLYGSVTADPLCPGGDGRTGTTGGDGRPQSGKDPLGRHAAIPASLSAWQAWQTGGWP
jgi:hypothetical protein